MAKFPTSDELKYSSNEQAIIEKLEVTYVGKNRDVDNRHLMDVIKNIFHSCKLMKNAVQSPLENADYELKDDIRYTIHKLSWKIICNWACEKDVEKTVHELLDFLSEYSWDATVVLILAAFAMNHGELLLIEQSPEENPIAKFVHKLKNPSRFLGSNKDLILYVEHLKVLVDQMLAVAEVLIQFKEQASIQKFELSASVRKVFCILAYRTLQSVVKCISFTMEMVKMEDKYQDFPTMIEQIITSCRFTTFHAYLEKSKFFELEYNGIVWTFKKTDDVVKLVLNIFSAKGNHIRRFDGTNEKMINVNLDMFKGNTVAFFVAEFNVKQKDFLVLKETYNRVKEKGFEVLWISVVDQSIDWNDATLQEDFEKVMCEMPWWSLTYPLTSNNAVWWYIKQDWQFQRTPMLVVLDRCAKVIHTNALPMVNYWHEAAFPFSMEKEAKLWVERSPTIINIIKQIKPFPEVKQGEIICVYGSHDMSWVHDFLCFIKRFEGKGAEVRTIYVGTNQRKQKLQKILMGFESSEKATLWSAESILSFWRDLENVAASKLVQSGENLEDAIKNEFATILSYDNEDDGWALMFKNSSKFIFSGKQLKYCWKNEKDWMGKVKTSDQDILKVMVEYLTPMKLEREHCIHLTAPITSSNLVVPCPECGRAMEKTFVYKCCIK